MNKTIFLHKDIEVLIVSAGGVGTTFFMEAIGEYKKTNTTTNTDGYKHLPIPPISFNPDLKVIYIFGNPILASISLFRRQYHNTQSHWLQKYHDKNALLPIEMTLEQYAQQQNNRLLFRRHFNNWSEKYPMYPTMFVKYENIYDSLEAIADFLELPSSFLENFPKKKTRKSAIENLDKTTIQGLQKMYAPFQKKVVELPPFFINKIQKPKITASFYCSKPYRKAFIEAFLKRFTLLRKVINKIKSIQ